MIMSFNVKFITPLLIGSAEANNSGDNIGLTGKALRGAWRFWFRAMVGGCLQNPDPKYIAELEEMVFGSTARSTFRLLVIPDDEIEFGDKIARLPSTSQKYPAYFYNPVMDGNGFHITITPRLAENNENLPVLLATIWVWAHLGAIGNRSRRGFGSPVITQSSQFIEKFNETLKKPKVSGITDVQFPRVQETYDSRNALAEYLEKGLKDIYGIFKSWINSNKKVVSGDIDNNPVPLNQPYFILASLGQISIGNILFPNFEEAKAAIHGDSTCDELGRGGGTKGRYASPAYIRLHQCLDARKRAALVPVMTWCQQEGISSYPAGPIRGFFDKAGFKDTL